MKRVIYISVPMDGRERNAIAGDVEGAMGFCRKRFADEDLRFISPLDLAAEMEGLWKLMPIIKEENGRAMFAPAYGHYLGYDIAVLIEKADMVFFCEGWEHSKGCRLEREAARLFGKGILSEI